MAESSHAILTGIIDSNKADKRIVKLTMLTRDIVRIGTAYEINADQIDILAVKIRQRAKLLEAIYGGQAMTFCEHELHHLPEALRRTGSAVCTWCFTPERKNGIIAKRIANTNKSDIQKQLVEMVSPCFNTECFSPASFHTRSCLSFGRSSFSGGPRTTLVHTAPPSAPQTPRNQH